MRNMILMVAGALFVASLAIPANAGVPTMRTLHRVVAGSDMTVKGEVVDIACAIAKKDAGKGAGHANCAMVCARKGQPVGILTADAVYTVTGDYTANSNATLLDFVARNVVVTGDVTEKDGVKSINVKSIKLASDY